MKSSFSIFLFLFFSSSLGYRFLEDSEPDMPYFPAEYRVKGERFSVISQIVTPFEAWYSSEYNKSRIDYFDGMVKKYYYAETEDYEGQAFEIHPVTNEEITNEMVCFESKYKGEQKDFLPDPEGYKLEDYEVINGQHTGKWMKITGAEDDSGTKIEETIWINTFDKNWQGIPVRYEVKKFNNWLGKLDAHTITNYFDFEATAASEDLEVEERDAFVIYLKELTPMPPADQQINWIATSNIHWNSNIRQGKFRSIHFYGSNSTNSRNECEFKKVKKGDLSTLAFVEPEDEEDVDIVFNQFKHKHSRQYADNREHETRRAIFRRNLEKVLTTNHKRLGYKLALNEFADRAEEELHHLTTLRPSDPHTVGTIPFPYEENEIDKLADDFPKEFDMRLDGVITPVQNQETCGSCWAFSLTSATEGAIARSNGGRTLRLSPQALVDCAWGYSEKGCNGGELESGFRFILKHGVPTVEDYGTYLSMDGYCRLQDMPKVQTIKGFTKVTPHSENALKVALYNHGPVAVAIHASDDMLLYSGGVFYDVNCERPRTTVNHGVTVVGYGEKNGETYWIVKNSWGQDWGSGGYILMSAKNNNCLVESEPYYAVV